MADGISLPTIPWQTMMLDNTVEGSVNSFKKGSSPGGSNLPLKEACAELESLFINYLFKEMRATVPKTGFISGGKAEEIYTSMLDMELAKELSRNGGIGLSELLAAELDGKGERNPDGSVMPKKTE